MDLPRRNRDGLEMAITEKDRSLSDLLRMDDKAIGGGSDSPYWKGGGI